MIKRLYELFSPLEPSEILRWNKAQSRPAQIPESGNQNWEKTVRQGSELPADLVPGYFVPRPSDDHDDSVILKRIIAAYNLAKVTQKNAGEAFNVSNEWLSIYERNLGPVMKALFSEDAAELQRTYQNFFRDPCSTGLAGLPINIPKLFSGGDIKQKFREYILYNVLHRYELSKQRTGNKYTAAALSAPLVGNPYGPTIDGVFIRPGADSTLLRSRHS